MKILKILKKKSGLLINVWFIFSVIVLLLIVGYIVFKIKQNQAKPKFTSPGMSSNGTSNFQPPISN